MDLHTTASMYPAISTTDLMRLPFPMPDDATIKKVKQQITAAQRPLASVSGLIPARRSGRASRRSCYQLWLDR